MNASARNLLVAALVVGIDGDRLLRGGTWRFGFALWIAGLVICTVAVGGRGSRERQLMLGGTVLAAFGLVLRDSPTLYAIDMLSVLCMGALTIWLGSGRGVADLTIVESVRAALLAVINTIGGGAGVIGAAMERGEHNDATTRRAGALAVGTVLAIPPLVIVGALLAKSDKVFDGALSSFTNAIMSDGLAHAIPIALLAWIATGWMRATLGDAIGATVDAPSSPALPFVTISIALYALIALLGAFVVVQARVLFGGAEFLRATDGLTVATYARDGFFQLILAAAVVLATLVMAEWLMTADDALARRRYRSAATVLLALVGTLLVSSAVRIGLYVNEFGLSVDRTFACAAIVWVGAALAAFSATTLRGQGAKFMPVTLLVTVTWVTMVNLINPDAIVVRVNVARAARSHAFDAAFHARLSADALPAILANAYQLSASDCSALELAMRARDVLPFLVAVTSATATAGAGAGATASATANTSERASRADWRGMSLPLWRAQAWRTSGRHVCSVAR